MTKANRRRRKMGGRPRIEGPEVTREPNGRVTRSLRKTETEKEARAVVIEARARIYGASVQDCALQDFGSVLGRLFLAKLITKRQYDAGSRYGEDYSRYCGLTGIPHPGGRAQDILRVKGRGSEAPNEVIKAAADHVQKIETLLGLVDVAGRPVTSITKRVCILDDGQGMEYPHMIKHLARGLEALANHFGIERQEAA